jgi:hypothetical protein
MLGNEADLLEAAAWFHDTASRTTWPTPAFTHLTAPATSVTSSMPTLCGAAWSRTIPAQSSKPKNDD